MTTPGRNNPCPCGSGKKYKHCCANSQAGTAAPTIALPEGGKSSVPAALQIAIQHHQAGRLRKAEALYQQILQVQPRNVDALHLHGLVMHQLGQHEIAHDLIGKAIALNPNVGNFYNNLGEVCRAMNRLDEACSHYKKALSLQPAFPEACRNLGLALRAQGKTEAAIACFNQAISLNPGYVDACLALGETLHGLRKLDEAIACYAKGLSIQPDNPSLLSSMGIALRASGKLEDAIRHYQQAIVRCPKVPELYNNLAIIYQGQHDFSQAAACLRKVLELTPNDDSARHLLNAMESTPSERAPAGYVRETFDDYAASFDQHLVDKLEYQTPTLLGNVIKDELGPVPHALDILDLGCGTGLFGVQVQDIKAHLTGVDLAPKMIAKAQERGIYDRLVVADLLECLGDATPQSLDLVAATDVFIYVGNIAPIFEQCRRVLRPGGLFAFSLEAHPDDDRDFLLDTTGRYQQSRGYIERLSSQFGFSERHFSLTTLRKQQDQPVGGYLYLLEKA